MKKLVLILMIFVLTFMTYAGERFSLSIHGNLYIPKDKDFKDFYGNTHFFPETKFKVTVYNGFYLWGSYGFYKASGLTSPQLQEEIKWTQHFFGYGGGYNLQLTSSLSGNLSLGGITTTYKEEALEAEIKKTTTGFYMSGSIVYSFFPSLFTELEVGYISVSQDIEDFSVNLGGLKAGLGIGIRF